MSLLTSAVSMTKAMVRIDSTDPGTYEKAMADWIEQQLSDLPNVIITRKEVPAWAVPNLMAEISGARGASGSGYDLPYGYRRHRGRMDHAAF